MNSNQIQRDIGPVLITGCSSGIGKFLAQYLAEQSIKVYASARKLPDLEWIDNLAKFPRENIIRLQLDVTNPDSISKAQIFITENRIGLYAIVNNAGIGDLGFHTTFSEEEMHYIFNVNVFGPWRITNAFIDLLIESKGRIINIGSQGGMITKKLYGPYSMTKFALEAYSDSLREELSHFNVFVSIIQPGGIITEIGKKSLTGIVNRLERARYPFKKEADQILQRINEPPVVPTESSNNQPESESNRKPSSPSIVAEAVLDALINPKPKKRYLVGTKWEGNRVIHGLIEKLLDENDNPVHNYSLEELFELLKEKRLTHS